MMKCKHTHTHSQRLIAIARQPVALRVCDLNSIAKVQKKT